MSLQHDRPWYCRDDVVDEYKSTLTTDDEKLPMLKALKLLRAIIVNVGVFVIVLYGMYIGGDPTILGLSGLATVGAYNGLELSDYMALVQAYQEIQRERNDD